MPETKELPFADVKETEEKPEETTEKETAEDENIFDKADLVSRLEDAENRTPEEIESDIRQIDALAQSYPEIKEMQEYKNLVEIAEKNKEKPEDEKEDEDEEDAVTKDKKEEKEDDENEEEESADVFGLTNEKKKPKNVDLGQAPKELLSYIKKSYSTEDMDTVMTSVDKWRKDRQQQADTVEEYNNVLAGLEDLPAPIKEAITAYAEAKDYYEAFNKHGERLNYNIDFDNQPKEAVVQHYFTDKVIKLNRKLDDEEIDEDEYNERIDDLHDATKVLYEAEKCPHCAEWIGSTQRTKTCPKCGRQNRAQDYNCINCGAAI